MEFGQAERAESEKNCGRCLPQKHRDAGGPRAALPQPQDALPTPRATGPHHLCPPRRDRRKAQRDDETRPSTQLAPRGGPRDGTTGGEPKPIHEENFLHETAASRAETEHCWEAWIAPERTNAASAHRFLLPPSGGVSPSGNPQQATRRAWTARSTHPARRTAPPRRDQRCRDPE